MEPNMTQDDAREAMSLANENLHAAEKAMRAAHMEYDQAEADGDPYAITRAEMFLYIAEQELDRSIREQAAAESALVAAALADGEW